MCYRHFIVNNSILVKSNLGWWCFVESILEDGNFSNLSPWRLWNVTNQLFFILFMMASKQFPFVPSRWPASHFFPLRSCNADDTQVWLFFLSFANRNGLQATPFLFTHPNVLSSYIRYSPFTWASKIFFSSMNEESKRRIKRACRLDHAVTSVLATSSPVLGLIRGN